MNTSVDGIIVNNCQYAPIYLIQDPGPTQVNTYVLTSNCVEQTKPVSNNLKTFYENSGNIENGFVNVDTAVKPSIPKKKECVLIGNNLKLASFLLPKTEPVNKQYVVDNIVLKPNITTTTTTPMPVPVTTVPVNTVPKIDMDRKIVKLKDTPVINRVRPDKFVPKIKPKESIPSPNQSKHTSVQLIKLGETYHSLNHLSKDQVKMVNHALKMFKDPDKGSLGPAYDPVTNTRYIYKVVSPKDLAVVSQKKFVVKEKKLTKIPKKIVDEKIKQIKQMKPYREVIEKSPEPEPVAETKITRSGRKVKLPKQILQEDASHKSKKKSGTVISCFQCSTEFCSLYRLQKHYEHHPTHIPTKIHSNLFHCLLAIIKSGCDGDKTNIFIQQLEQLVVKLKSLLPCLLKKVDGSEGQSCTINDDVSRLFGMNPGKYNINVGALNCVKDKSGYCVHNPPKLNKYIKDHRPAILTRPSEDMNNCDNETENCARINSVAKWPTVSKRIWKLKNKSQHEINAKKMRLKSEGDTHIDLEMDDFICEKVQTDVDNIVNKPISTGNNMETEINPVQETIIETNDTVTTEQNIPKNGYIQFHSAHFDIRSSPIKASSSSTVFRKIQINQNQLKVIHSLEDIDKNQEKLPHGLSNQNKNLHISSANDSIPMTVTNSNGNLHIPMSNTSNSLHIPMSISADSLHNNITMPNSNNNLPNTSNSLHTLPSSETTPSARYIKSEYNSHVSLTNSLSGLHMALSGTDPNLQLPISDSENSMPVSNTENSLDLSLVNTENSLHDIFKDDVELSCKDDSSIDPVLKDWIISTKSDSLQCFTKSNGLMESEFLRGTDGVDNDKSIEKSIMHNGDMPSLDATDNRLLASHSESVLNFLETLGNELVYPETEIRNSGVDFQLDLFTFHNS